MRSARLITAAMLTLLLAPACGADTEQGAANGAASVGGNDASGSAGASGGSVAVGTGGTAGSNSTATSGSHQGGSSDAAGSGGNTLGGGSGAGASGSDILEPAQGALLGQYYGDGDIAETTAKLGRTLRLHLTYYGWQDDWYNAKPDLDAGRIPFVNWEPFDTDLDDIINGTYDELIKQRASDAKELAHKFFLDFGPEMNGEWSPWGGAANGMSAEKYLAAYRHVHDLIVAEGATNIVWVWCPNVTDEPSESWNEAFDYYPGDEYVDWTCVDGYNWGETNGIGWQSFSEVFAGIYPKLAAKGKPIMIGEMASAESGGDKASWIQSIIPTLRDEFPLIKGLIWFDIDKETDWRISSSPEAEAAFIAMASDAYFNP